MPFISYAQNQEDVLLWRALGHVREGFYVDVGAQHPEGDSVSKVFYDRGWRGIDIEPVPKYAALLRRARPRGAVVEAAIGERPGRLTLFAFEATGTSTFVERFADRSREVFGIDPEPIEVEVTTLDAVLEAAAPPEIHWLKIDVEGFEEKALRGLDLTRWRPWVIVVEAMEPHGAASLHEAWEHLVVARGYRFVYFDGLNRFYIAEERAELAVALDRQANVLDGFVTAALATCTAEVGRLHRHIAHLDAQSAGARDGGDRSYRHAAAADALAAETRRMLEEEIARLREHAGRLDALREQEKALREGEKALREGEKSLREHEKARREHAFGQWAEKRRELEEELDRLHRRLAAVDAEQAAEIERAARRSWLAVAARGAASPLGELRRMRKRLSRSLRKRLRRLTRRDARDAAPSPEALPAPRERRVFGGSTPDLADTAPIALGPRAGGRILYVFVDHTARLEINTGVQRVVRQLARALAETEERVRFVGWEPGAKRLRALSAAEAEKLAEWSGPAADAAESFEGEVGSKDAAPGDWLILPELAHDFAGEPATLDVILESRRLGLRIAALFYDATPLVRPEFADVAPIHEAYVSQLLQADLILPISRSSGDDLLALRALRERDPRADAPRIAPLPLPDGLPGAPRVGENGASSERLILTVGSITPHKNQTTLLDAMERLLAARPELDWRLVMVGHVHPDCAARVVAACGDPRIERRVNISDRELAALYDGAAFTVFPSVEEGFGLPILESLRRGRPCVCAGWGAMAEAAAGGGCLTVDVSDPEALVRAIARLIDEPDLRARLAEEAFARPIRDWADYVGDLRRMLDEVADPLAGLGRVYYSIDHTSRFPTNTGIQRVARLLARSLIEVGVEAIPVVWDRRAERLAPAPADALAHVARWNGPAPEQWSPWVDPSEAAPADWLLIPEVMHPEPGLYDGLARRLDELGLRGAWIFFDAIPWSMSEIYTAHFTEAHVGYMSALARFTMILPISEDAKRELLAFYLTTRDRLHSPDHRIQTAALPGELPGTRRAEGPKTSGAADGCVRILSVGTLERRKNHVTLLDAVERLRGTTRRPFRLTLAGGPHPDLEAALRPRIAATPEVDWIECADDARLAELFEDCDFTVYPSLKEGFGLPIAESLWRGRPCVCADWSAMGEAAKAGGCLTADVSDADALADALRTLIDDEGLRLALAREAVAAPARPWTDYAREIAARLAAERPAPAGCAPAPRACGRRFVNLAPRPTLSVCVSTYNRAGWLAVALEALLRQLPQPSAEVEVLVVDNASTDDTPRVVAAHAGRPDLRSVRNARNVGMLGNLRVTAQAARGEYVWILGDDDILKPGAVARVLGAIRDNPGAALVYLNYAYTREEAPRRFRAIDDFLASGTPVAPPGPDRSGPIREFAAQTENFFTAIYCLVYRRDHALRAYCQNTAGRPFSSLATCIPTTLHTLTHMMDEPGVWIGEPQLVVNMNVSWMKYAPLWLLERIPETLDLAERRGADPAAVDRWRVHHLPGLKHYWREILTDDPEGNAEFVSLQRVVLRFRHLPEFAVIAPELRAAYEEAAARGHPLARLPAGQLFAFLADDADDAEEPAEPAARAAAS